MTKKNRSSLIFIGVIVLVLAGLEVAGSRGSKGPDCTKCHNDMPAGTKMPPNHPPIAGGDRR